MRPHVERLTASFVAAVAFGACHDGSVRLELDVPASDALDPLAGAQAITLSAKDGAGARVFSATIDVPERGAALGFGEVPVRDDLWFELQASAAAGRVVGFGRSTTAIDVSDDAEVRVPVRVRRPFAYVAGSDALVTIDAAREPGEDYVSSIAIGGAVRAVAATFDGAEVVVATEAAVRLVSTRTHAALPGEVVLPGAPAALAVSPDGRWAAIVHPDPPSGLSLVDLAALRAGAPVAPTFVAIATPGAIGIGGGVVWVLVAPLTSLFCGGASSVIAVPLDAPAPSSPIALPARASDLAVDPVSGAAVVAVTCGDMVMAVDDPGATPRLVLARPGLGAVTVADGRVWIAGHVDGADAHLTLTDVSLDGADVRTLDLPTTEERAVAVALEQMGQEGQIALTADLHTAFAVSVLPDRAHVAILDIAVYIGEAQGDAGGGRPVVPAMQMVSYDYQLVRRDTGLSAQRLRLSCNIAWKPGALLDAFRCARAPGQDEVAAPFEATDLSVLHGSR